MRRVNFLWSLEDDFELEVELELCIVQILGEMRVWGTDSQVKVGHGQPDLLVVLRIGEDVGVKADGVFLDGVGDLFVGGKEDEWLRVDSSLFKHAIREQ